MAELKIEVIHEIRAANAAAVAWSPDGDQLAIPDSEGLNLYTLADGTLSQYVRPRRLFAAAWSPDGSQIAIGGEGSSGILTIRDGMYRELLDDWSIPCIGYFGRDHVVLGGWNAPAYQVRVDRRLQLTQARISCFALCFDPGGRLYVASGTMIEALSPNSFRQMAQHDLDQDVDFLAISRGSRHLAAVTGDTTVIFDPRSLRSMIRIEDDARPRAVVFSPLGDLLVVVSAHEVAIWTTDSWSLTATLPFEGKNIRDPAQEVAYCPTDDRLLAVVGANGVSICRLVESTAATTRLPEQRRYATARVALVGDSMVGKTHLGHRIAKGDWQAYPSTHGQEFWVVDDLGATRDDGVECEAVLWDFAGQDDYRLVHALFLDDVDVALLLFDPSERRRPLASVDYWRRQLRTAEESGCEKVLVGTKVDRGTPALTNDILLRYCEENGIVGGYVGTSALEGTGIEALKARIIEVIDWSSRPATITTEVFKRIKELTLEVKERATGGDVLVSPAGLRKRLTEADPDFTYTGEELLAAAGHLATHGYVKVLTTAGGDTEVLLTPETMVKLASSLVLLARSNTRGLGSIEEAPLLAGDHSFAELADLDADQRNTLFDAVTALFLRANLCFRETSGQRVLLVFPSLIHEQAPPDDDIALRDGVSYSVAGSVAQVYPALVVLLGYSEVFVGRSHWQSQARYELGPGEVCGFRLQQDHQGRIDIVLNAAATTPPATQLLFEGLVERFLIQRRGISIRKYPAVDCDRCGRRLERPRLVEALDAQKGALRCDGCDSLVPLHVKATEVGWTGRSDPAVARGEARARRRTNYETALVAIKRLALDAVVVRPTCFVSYAWGDPVHERWVESLVQDLKLAGVDVLLDQWHSPPGTSLTQYIDRIDACSYVLVVGTPDLRAKYDRPDDDAVVAAELRLITERLRRGRAARESVIPLLRAGDKTSFPPQFQDPVAVDFRSDVAYFAKLVDLLLVLHGIPFGHPGAIEVRRQMEVGPNEVD